MLRSAGVSVDHVEIRSPWGHDSFLLELPAYHQAVTVLGTAPAPRPRNLAIG